MSTSFLEKFFALISYQKTFSYCAKKNIRIVNLTLKIICREIKNIFCKTTFFCNEPGGALGLYSPAHIITEISVTVYQRGGWFHVRRHFEEIEGKLLA